MKKLLLLTFLFVLTLSLAKAQKQFEMDLSNTFIVKGANLNPNFVDTVTAPTPISVNFEIKNLGTFKGKGNPNGEDSFPGGSYKFNYFITLKSDNKHTAISGTKILTLTGAAYLGSIGLTDTINIDPRFTPDEKSIVIIWPTGDRGSVSKDSLDDSLQTEIYVYVKENSAGISKIATTVSNNFKIYPNPVKDVLNIIMTTGGKGTLKLTDIEGRIIATQSFDAVEGGNVAMPLSDRITVPNGVYFISVETATYKEVSKIVVGR